MTKIIEDSRKIFENLFNRSLDLLCIAGLDGYFKHINPMFREVLGYTDEELLSTPFIEFVHPDDRKATLAEVESLSKGSKTVSFINRYRCKDGMYKWLEWNTRPVVEEGILYGKGKSSRCYFNISGGITLWIKR